jgi:hypothetical protein
MSRLLTEIKIINNNTAFLSFGYLSLSLVFRTSRLDFLHHPPSLIISSITLLKLLFVGTDRQ